MRQPLVLILFLNLSCAQLTLNAQNMDGESMQDSIETILDDNNIPGLFVSVVSKDSVIWQQCFGYAEFEKREKVTPQHLFRIGSITKTFTAMAIVRLIKEGKLNLDDELRTIAPEVPFQNKWASKYPVKVKHLLEHKAGFDDMHLAVIAKERPKKMTAFEEILVHKNSLKSRWEPGLIHSYSNAGYVILGYLIEKKSGIPYQQYIKENVLNTLNMNATHFISQTKKGDSFKYSNGYNFENEKFSETKKSNIVGETAGSLMSNADDMSKFLQFFLNQKLQDSILLIGSSGVSEMEQLHSWFEIENNIPKGYGLGLGDREFGANGFSFWGHNGGISGFVSDMIYNREHDIGIVISNNGQRGNRKIINLLVDNFIPEKKVEQKKIGKKIPISKDWDGEYYPVNERNGLFSFINGPANTLKIEATEDSLLVHYFMEGTYSFAPVNETSFIDLEDHHPWLFLTKKNKENTILYYETLYEPVNSFGLFIFRLAIGLGLFSAIILSVIFLVQLIVSFFKPSWRKTLKFSFLVVLPFWLFLGSIFLFASHSSLKAITTLGTISFASVSIFLMTAFLPITSVVAIYFLYKKQVSINSKALKYFYFLTTFLGVFLMFYCIHNNWFAIRLWSY